MRDQSYGPNSGGTAGREPINGTALAQGPSVHVILQRQGELTDGLYGRVMELQDRLGTVLRAPYPPSPSPNVAHGKEAPYDGSPLGAMLDQQCQRLGVLTAIVEDLLTRLEI